MTQQLKNYIKILVENELYNVQYPNPPKIVVYLDMDGVLADIETSFYDNAQLKKNKEEYEKILSSNEEFKNLSDEQIKKSLAGVQTDPGLKALKNSWNEFKSKKYLVAGEPGFFLNLQQMPDASQLVDGVISMTGNLPGILTAPIDGSMEICEKEKLQWMNNNFAGKFSSFHCTKNKSQYAKPGAVLIDDREKYVNPFINAGGIGILHTSATTSLQELQKVITNINSQRNNS